MGEATSIKQELQRDELKSSGAQGILESFSHSAPHLMHLTRNLFMHDICPKFQLAVHRRADSDRLDEWGNLFQQGAGRPSLLPLLACPNVISHGVGYNGVMTGSYRDAMTGYTEKTQL